MPTQSRIQWQASLEKTIALQPEHVAAYCLTYEEDTDFFARFTRGELTQDSGWDADLFEATMDTLCGAGYVQYEISNYAKPGHDCLHNLAYWLGADYLGLGPSAFSTVGGRRWQNVADTSIYCDRIGKEESAESFSEALSTEIRQSERIAFGLRTNRGVLREVMEPWEREVTQFEADGFLRTEGSSVMLTRAGKLMADSVAQTFV